MKEGIRVLGVDDAAFELEDSSTELVGVVYRGTQFIEDIKLSSVTVDGEDSSESVVELFERCNNTDHIQAVLVDGISFAGFNVVDLEMVSEKTGLPVIAVTSNRPDREDFRQTMERNGSSSEAFERLEEPSELEVEAGTVYYQYAGTGKREARDYLRYTLLQGLTPEPVRVAHMIGRALFDTD
jgi:hypothetical protein